MEYAHRRGVTHRDLKASNVLISFTGQAKLVDFGLAGGDAAVSKVVRGKGQPRTVDYAALESLGGVKDDSVRSDIYFLGTIAYLALSGVSPLTESRDRSIRSDPRRFTSVESLGFRNPDLPRDIVEVVSRMMQINPVGRWQTAMEVRRALEPLAAKYAVGTAMPAGQQDQHRAAAGPKQPAAPQSTTKGTLMLVEASPQDQAELRGVFKDLGYRVLLTENLDRAMVRCSATPRAADCLVISANSCGEEGVEVFNRLPHDDFLRSLPAVLLVDPAQSDLVVLARSDDLRQVVTTPPQPEELGKVLDGLFGRA